MTNSVSIVFTFVTSYIHDFFFYSGFLFANALITFTTAIIAHVFIYLVRSSIYDLQILMFMCFLFVSLITNTYKNSFPSAIPNFKSYLNLISGQKQLERGTFCGTYRFIKGSTIYKGRVCYRASICTILF